MPINNIEKSASDILHFLAKVLTHASLAQYDFLTKLLCERKRTEFIAATYLVAQRLSVKDRAIDNAIEKIGNIDIEVLDTVSDIEFASIIAKLTSAKIKHRKADECSENRPILTIGD